MVTKVALRADITAIRRARPEALRDAERAAIRVQVTDLVDRLGLAAGATIAAYEPLRSEPGSVELLADLHALGHRVLVPVTLPDRDLDWTQWHPEATGPRPLGLFAVAKAQLVLVPALAVDRGGNRLGRGGGSYDRALARLAAGVPVVALLFTGELVPEVPADPWDRPVTGAVTPAGLTHTPSA